MKTKLLLLIVALFSFAASCEPEEPQQQTQEIETCECRQSFYTNQVVNYGFQFVWTHDGQWQQVDVKYRNMGTFQWSSGYYLTGLINYQDDDHAYKWECKNE